MSTKIRTKYGGYINFESYREYTVNNVFKILPLKEKDKSWEKHLTSLLKELSGIESLVEEAYFIAVLGKLESLFTEEDMAFFRKTVLDSITLVKKIKVKS